MVEISTFIFLGEEMLHNNALRKIGTISRIREVLLLWRKLVSKTIPGVIGLGIFKERTCLDNTSMGRF